jgi:hypothetical protein
MSIYVGMNRRAGGDRRVLNSGGNYERSPNDRRQRGNDNYVLVMGHIGIDRFGLMVGFPVALLLAAALVSAFVRP